MVVIEVIHNEVT